LSQVATRRRLSRAELVRQILAHKANSEFLAAQLRDVRGQVANRAFEILEARHAGHDLALNQMAEAFLRTYRDMTTRGVFAHQVVLQEYSADPCAYQLRDPGVQIQPARTTRVLVEIPTLLAVWTLLAREVRGLPSPALGRREERIKFSNRPPVYVLKA